MLWPRTEIMKSAKAAAESAQFAILLSETNVSPGHNCLLSRSRSSRAAFAVALFLHRSRCERSSRTSHVSQRPWCPGTRRLCRYAPMPKWLVQSWARPDAWARFRNRYSFLVPPTGSVLNSCSPLPLAELAQRVVQVAFVSFRMPRCHRLSHTRGVSSHVSWEGSSLSRP